MDRWTRIVESWRRHERRWIVVYLAVILLGAAIVALPQTRARFLATVGRAVDLTDSRWDARLEHGLGLVESGAYEEAALYLERLDREFPAPTSRARRDYQREALLYGLAASHEALGRRGRTIAAYQRLVAFDPRNFQSHYQLAQAHLRLASGWSVPDEAHAAFAAALAINPNHLGSVREVMRFSFDRGDFAGTIATFDRYLAATLRQNLRVVMGDSVAIVRVPVDGMWHDIEVAVPKVRPDSVALLTDGFAVEVGPVRLAAALGAGQASTGPSTITAPLRSVAGLEPGPAGRLVPVSTDTRVVFSLPDSVAITRLALRVRLFKPVDPDSWSMATRSYYNRLDEISPVRALERIQPLPGTLADSVVPFYLD